MTARVGVGIAVVVVLTVVSGGLVSAADGQQTKNDLQTIERLLEEYGKQPFIELIRDKRHGTISVQVGSTIRKSVGPPNKKYVTPLSILYDLRATGITMAELPAELTPHLDAERSQPIVITQKDVGEFSNAGDTGGAATSDSPREGGGRLATDGAHRQQLCHAAITSQIRKELPEEKVAGFDPYVRVFAGETSAINVYTVKLESGATVTANCHIEITLVENGQEERITGATLENAPEPEAEK